VLEGWQQHGNGCHPQARSRRRGIASPGHRSQAQQKFYDDTCQKQAFGARQQQEGCMLLRQLGLDMSQPGPQRTTVLFAAADMPVEPAEFEQLPALAEWLGAVAADCPLLIVAAAALIRRGLLDPARLPGSDRIRAEIVEAFRDAMTAGAKHR
jgi:hypothetical protein